jgi:hypothetical protein
MYLEKPEFTYNLEWREYIISCKNWICKMQAALGYKEHMENK